MAVFQGPSFAGEQITMTRDDMIRMAREAGWQYADGDGGYEGLWAFADLVAAHEREAILQMLERYWFRTQADVEQVIRARGNNAD